MRSALLVVIGLTFLGACATSNQSAAPFEVTNVEQEAASAGGVFSGRSLFARSNPTRSGNGFANAAPKPGDPDYTQVAYGDHVPFGQVARLCNTPARKLGTKIDAVGSFTLIDSRSGGTTLRPLYLDGFKDGCVRQFTGALAVLSDPSTHESMYYGPAGATLSKTSVTRAYEGVKSRICRVATGKPCGRNISRLNKNTAFVTVYNQFGGGTWTTMLAHDGALVAVEN